MPDSTLKAAVPTSPAAAWLLIGLAAAGCFRDTRPVFDTFGDFADALITELDAEGAFAGLVVLDAATGNTIYEKNGARRGIPASTLKLLATSTALAELGADFRFKTEVRIAGALEADTLAADLVVAASGDPSLGSWRWPETDAAAVCTKVAQALVDKGVKRWRGRVRVDLPLASPEDHLGPGWFWDDLAYDFSAAPTPFVWRENVVDLTVKRRANAACDALPNVTIAPDPGEIRVDVRTEQGETSGFSCVRDRMSTNAHCVWRNAPLMCPREATMKLTVDDPADRFAACVETAVRFAGIERGGFLPEPANGAATPQETLVVLESPPLAAIVKQTNKESLNLYAERLALTITQRRTGQATYPLLRKTMDLELATRGLGPKDIVAVDGSGLSRYNQATPAALARIVFTGMRAPTGSTFLDSLAISGTDGTLLKRAASAIAKGQIHAKTGSMTGQRAFAGVVQRVGDDRYPWVVFALMIGNQSQAILTSSEAFDRLAEGLVLLRMKPAGAVVR